MRLQGTERPDRLRRARPAQGHGLDRGPLGGSRPGPGNPAQAHVQAHTGRRDRHPWSPAPATPAGAAARDPAAKQAEAAKPEMHPWTAEPLAAFLAWSAQHSSQLHPAWKVLAMTGMRRGECLALRSKSN